jgi:hypothetical protein
MRKGILSLSMPGRGKAAGKKKTKNMELAEQAAAKKATVAEEQEAVKNQEKAFVQTIKIPKPGMVLKKAKRRRGIPGGTGGHREGK